MGIATKGTSAKDLMALQDIMAGKSKPKTEKEGMMAMSAIMWKKSFELALRSSAEQDADAVSSPERAAVKDQQATMMAVQAAAALGDSLGSQLLHATRHATKS